jgi:hypothetical protein
MMAASWAIDAVMQCRRNVVPYDVRIVGNIANNGVANTVRVHLYDTNETSLGSGNPASLTLVFVLYYT